MSVQNFIAMTKAEIVKEIVRKTGVRAVTAAWSFSGSPPVAFSSRVGSFIIKEQAQKTARDITRNKTIVVPARRIAAFRPSKELSERVR